MRNVFMAVGLMGVMACAAPSEVGPSTDGAVNVAPIAIDLIFAGDPDDGGEGESVQHQQGQARFDDGEAGARAMNTLPPDLSVDVPIPLGTEVTVEYLAARASRIADLLRGKGYAVESVCIGSVCSAKHLLR